MAVYSQNALHRTIAMLGRGDATRGVSVACAVLLTLTGAAAQHVEPVTLSAILFLAGAALVYLAGSLPTSTASTARAIAAPAIIPLTMPRAASSACLQELLVPRQTHSACDRAAFARLTAHMSHELRTPLNAIIGFSEMMSNEVFGPLGSSCYAAYARDIHASGMSLLKSAEDALAITTLLTATEHQHRSSVTHAASAAEDAIAFHAPALASRGITASCTVDRDAEILADAQAVRQLLINLIADATQRANDGCSLSLASRQDNGQIEILIGVSGSLKNGSGANDSFSMLLARTLSQLSSAQIIEDLETHQTGPDLHGDGRHVAVRFHRVAQNDFFSWTA